LDYNRHCTYIFGECILAHEELELTNANDARVLDYKSVHPTANKQGGHEFLHIPTNRIITRRRWTQTPIPSTIIYQIHKLAEWEEIQKDLKIMNRTNQILFDFTCIVGIDFDDEKFHDEN